MSLATTMKLLFLQIVTSFLFVTASALSPNGFTMDLIHRKTNSSSSRVANTQLGASPYADTIFDTTMYLMKLQIGTPPVEIEASLDTGSDLIWTQCLPCVNCYQQVAPIFDPSKSSTFKERRCSEGKGPDHPCPYNVVYADKTHSEGILASETVTLQSSLGQPFVMPEVMIGCGHDNTKLSPSTSGVIGLSWGSSSLISQMGENFLGLLSYCFSGKGTSKINFGSNAIVAGEGTVSTTMFMKPDKPGFYYLNLDAISVGDTRVETIGTPFQASDGNIIIDSGTTYTYLPESYCNKVNEGVEKVVTADRAAFRETLCYSSETIDIFPVITMHFSDGADLVLDKYNMYMDVGGGTFCLMLMCNAPSQGDAIFGNRAQNNFLVGYDTSSQLVSFQPTDCSSLWG